MQWGVEWAVGGLYVTRLEGDDVFSKGQQKASALAFASAPFIFNALTPAA